MSFREKLVLAGHMALTCIIQLALSSTPQFWPCCFSGKDLTHDIMGKYEHPSKPFTRVKSDKESWWEVIGKAGTAFAPYIAKLD